jgi:hypothetical protein
MTFVSKRGLTLCGDGNLSRLKRHPDANRLATFSACESLTVRHLAFDANGLDEGIDDLSAFRTPTRGGLAFRHVDHVRIDSTLSWDSRFQDPGPYLDRRDLGSEVPSDALRVHADRHAFFLEDCTDAWLTQNEIFSQQITVSNGRRIHITHNHIVNAVQRGIRILAGGDTATETATLDVSIFDNYIEQPLRHGIHCAVERADSTPETLDILARIRISRNTILKAAPDSEIVDRHHGDAITVGVTPLDAGQFGSALVHDIAIEGNAIAWTGGDPRLIHFERLTGLVRVYSGLVIRANSLSASNVTRGPGILLDDSLQDSVIVGNVIRGTFDDEGIRVTGLMARCCLSWNMISLPGSDGEAITAGASLGFNVVAGNAPIGERWHVDFVFESTDVSAPLIAPEHDE